VNNTHGTYGEFREWVRACEIVVLNVAGNRESVCPGVEQRTKTFLVEALKGM
jgi:hypothetical protein